MRWKSGRSESLVPIPQAHPPVADKPITHPGLGFAADPGTATLEHAILKCRTVCVVRDGHIMTHTLERARKAGPGGRPPWGRGKGWERQAWAPVLLATRAGGLVKPLIPQCRSQGASQEDRAFLPTRPGKDLPRARWNAKL